MGGNEILIEVCGLVVVGAPFLLLCVLGVPSLLGHPLDERAITRSIQVAMVSGLIATLCVAFSMLATDARHVPIELGSWVAIPHYHFSVKFVFDRLSVPLVILSFVLCGIISGFSSRYLHRESGFNRFHALFALFVLGMVVTALAGTIETLFAGWEMVGLSSALLVAFHLERPAPVRNGLRVWTVYRVSDAALLIAAVVMHHMAGEGDFDKLLVSASWPDGAPQLDPRQALVVGLLILLAAAGKSALVPFSGWLPRAMEGPTPSSAVFYGALSVHLGAFLLLRMGPLIDQSLSLQAIIVALGLVTALYSALIGRVQTDIKSVLAFASLTQVGLIVAEIGFGFRYVALVHILGNGCLRTLQFARAPSRLLDHNMLVNAIGSGPMKPAHTWERFMPLALQTRLYRLGIERGYLDAWLVDGISNTFLVTVRHWQAVERFWLGLLTGERTGHLDWQEPQVAMADDLE